MPEIEWIETQWSQRGSINGLPLWSVGYDGVSQTRGTYYVRCDLPGIKRDMHAESIEAGKALAARQFETFCKKLGLAPVPTEPDDEPDATEDEEARYYGEFGILPVPTEEAT